jgi:tRNA(Ile)-lysidine synthase TilS/MesJ
MGLPQKGGRRDSRAVDINKVALACSGGADSTYLAREVLAGRISAPKARVWVVDHGHRAGSLADAQEAVALYEEMGLPAEVLSVISADATENSLRNARYQAFEQAAQVQGVGMVLLAHQADDVDSGLWIRRPLLGVRRQKIREALVESGQRWLEDPTNADVSVAARNCLRHEVMPALAKISTGDPVLAVLRLAGEAGEWNECLQELLESAGPWKDLPSYLRRQSLAQRLRGLGETVSPARLVDLEGALLRKGFAKPTADITWKI